MNNLFKAGMGMFIIEFFVAAMGLIAYLALQIEWTLMILAVIFIAIFNLVAFILMIAGLVGKK